MNDVFSAPRMTSINGQCDVPFTVENASTEWYGYYELYEGAYVFRFPNGELAFGTDSTAYYVELERNEYNQSHQVWAAWYVLPDGSTIYEDVDGALFLYEPAPAIDLDVDNP